MSNHTKIEEEEEEEESYDELEEEDFEYQGQCLFDIKEVSIIPLNIKNYKISKRIGTNGFYRFFKLTNKASNDEFVAKIFVSTDRNISSNNKLLQSFKNDIEISSQLSHPSIAKFVGYSPTNFKRNQPMIILSGCSKCLFYDFLRMQIYEPNPQWNSTKKLLSIYSIASAMKYLHSLDIIHRNLTPNSILLDKNLNPKISDFFLAIRSPYDNNHNSEVIGTPAYIAPEIWVSSSYSKSSDVYAFAFLVYEILSNVSPFQGMDSYQIMYKISVSKYRPHLDDSISPAFKNLIEKCWDENPDHRPTFDEILNDLKSDENFISDDVNRDIYHELINDLDKF